MIKYTQWSLYFNDYPKYLWCCNYRQWHETYSDQSKVTNNAQHTICTPAWCTDKILPLGYSLRWSHNERDGISNHQPDHCLLKRLFRLRSKKISKLRVTGLYVGNSPVIGEFPTQMASNAENVSIWWCHHVSTPYLTMTDEVWEWIINFIPHFTGHVISYPCWDWRNGSAQYNN